MISDSEYMHLYIMPIEKDMNGTWSIAFNLNTNVKEATDFYFDDLSWQMVKKENNPNDC